MSNLKNPINFETAFQLLNEKLKEDNLELELICVGGYVLQLHGFKYTLDVDAFYNSNSELDQIIWKVGEQLGLNLDYEPWLNNSVSNMSRTPPKKYVEKTSQYSNLTVNSACLDYVVGMKLCSGREKDIEDVKDIIARDKKDLFGYKAELNEMGFHVDFSLLLDAYEKAFGLEWLANFYKDHEEKLMDLMYR